MMTPNLLATAWHWNPSIIAGCAALPSIYVWAARFRFSKSSMSFLIGVLVLLLSLVSPLEMLADPLQFSAHVFQHLILVLIVPPLLLAGIDRDLAKRILSLPGAASAERVVSRPTIAWLAGVGCLGFWHIPALFNASLASQPLRAVEYLSFVASGLIFWWPVMSPFPRTRLIAIPWTILYLITASLASSALAMTLIFWLSGHHAAGVFMCAVTCSIYLCGSAVIFTRWHRAGQTAARQVIATMPPPLVLEP